METQNSPRDEKLRDLLGVMVESDLASHAARRNRTKVIAAVLGVGLLGTGVASAAATIGGYWPSETEPTIPGGQITKTLTSGVDYDGKGDERIALPAAPSEATDLSVSFTCSEAGLFQWGLNESQMHSLECDQLTSANVDLPLLHGGRELIVEAHAGSAWTVSVRFVQKASTDWGVNARGETFGVAVPGSILPDLIAVNGRDASNQPLAGYVRVADWNAVQTDSPASPPANTLLPVFTSDGVTQIGTFQFGEVPVSTQ